MTFLQSVRYILGGVPDTLRIQWGSAPDWLAALGTIAAFVGLLYEIRRSRVERTSAEATRAEALASHNQAEREQQVRRVTAWLDDVGGDAADRNLAATVSNASEMAIYDIELKLVGVPDIPSRSLPVIAPGERRVVAQWLGVRVPGGSRLRVEVRFVDAQGVVWLRSDAQYAELGRVAERP